MLSRSPERSLSFGCSATLPGKSGQVIVTLFRATVSHAGESSPRYSRIPVVAVVFTLFPLASRAAAAVPFCEFRLPRAQRGP